MSEHPILFSGPMVRAILAGQKTMTRRVVKPQPDSGPGGRMVDLGGGCGGWGMLDGDLYGDWTCPYGAPGDLLWVRETWRVGAWSEDGEIAVDYRADGYSRREWLFVPDPDQFERLWIQSTDDALAAGRPTDASGRYHWTPGESPCRWRPSIFVPRWASRITLRVTDVRVERVQDITEEDAVREGVQAIPEAPASLTDRTAFARLWDSLNAKRGHGWDVNPWVWVVSFEGVAPREEKPE